VESSPAQGTPQSGFTLVEVLVSLVVLSIGLLGMAKLVLVTAHANDSAYLRSQATALAYQIIDNMRANLGGATTGGYVTALSAMPAAPTGCVAAACNNTQLGLWDVYSWKQHLSTSLPSGTGSIATSATFPVTATVIVQWDDSAAQSVFGAVAAGVAAPMNVTLETVLQ
jgi:type IV pilus assembly protein PilV